MTAISRSAVDLANFDEARQAAEAAGTVDYLVNNAAISILQPFLETTVEAFDRTMAVIARKMIENHLAGAIVNVSSQSSMLAVKDHTTYCVSKGALDQLTRMMALELGSHNIRVNSVNPIINLTPWEKWPGATRLRAAPYWRASLWAILRSLSMWRVRLPICSATNRTCSMARFCR